MQFDSNDQYVNVIKNFELYILINNGAFRENNLPHSFNILFSSPPYIKLHDINRSGGK